MGEPEIRRASSKGDAILIYIMISNSIGEGNFLLPRKGEEVEELVGEEKIFVASAKDLSEEEKLVGCAGLEEYDNIAELRSLVVDKEWWGRDIGERLIESVAELARERKYEMLYAFADKSLVGFYQKQGFTDRGRLLDMDRGEMTDEVLGKLEGYCRDCRRYKSGACMEHLMHKSLV